MKDRLTINILIAMLLGITLGLICHLFPKTAFINDVVSEGIFDVAGKVFINVLKMLVVPVVFVSLVCGTFNLSQHLNVGRVALKTFVYYIITTMLAITLALLVAKIVGVGGHDTPVATTKVFQPQKVPSLKATLLNIFPSNPIQAMAEGNMLQIIVFALMFGVAINRSEEHGAGIKKGFLALEQVIMNLVSLVIRVAPIGIFCLVTQIFAQSGLPLFLKLGGYFATVVTVLLLQLLGVYGLILGGFARLSPSIFFRKMAPAMSFAFSTSSSNASVPVVLSTVEKKLGVNNSIASFIIPLGATINMDGTAIMQGVATIFIANSYHINLSISALLKVIFTATLASIGTAGIPSVGLVTLMMVLIQVGLPVEGIAMIIGIDRLLDMLRTAVNICGDASIACLIGAQEKLIDNDCYNRETNAPC